MPAKSPLSRRERERLRQRDDILEAALRLFVQRGYHDVSMREIADAAEFATGTLYTFFESKEALYRELVALYARRIGGVMVSSLDAGADEREKISRYIHAHFRVLIEHAPAVQLYYTQAQALHDAPEVADGEVGRVREEALQRLADVIAVGMQRGIFRPLDPRHAAIALSGILQALLLANLANLPTLPADEIAAFAEDLFLRGLRADA